MLKLRHYCLGEWVDTGGPGVPLASAIDGKPVALAGTAEPDFAAILDYGRSRGGVALRKLSFHQRARLLKALALHLLDKKETLYALSSHTGATRADSWIDIEGGIGNLFTMSSKGRREMPDTPFFVEGRPEPLGKGGTFIGQHIYTPKEGVAIHINAFNFPVWGMLEKIAVNLLAGVPCVVKPATQTCYLTEATVRLIVASDILPEGALQLICGPARGLLDHADSQDVITFTGSAATGEKLKGHPAITARAVPFNMEADSLNCCVLGPDARPKTEEFDLFIREVAREMTVKAGQKCTAIRRAIVPASLLDQAAAALVARLQKVSVGDPRKKETRMGPLATLGQVEEVGERLGQLARHCQRLFEGRDNFHPIGGGAYMPPALLLCPQPAKTPEVHRIEAFGPVCTLMPYDSPEEAITLANMGQGSLVGSIVSADDGFVTEMALGCASHHGRLLALNRHCAKESTGHGSPLPQLVHGGPGRAGGGEEMGGLRGVFHYMQRTALQGHPATLSAITRVHQPNAPGHPPSKHPFGLYFEELQVGHRLTTARRTVTRADIDAFADLSGDHFYAHKADSDFSDTLFESQVAHGYFVIAAAAGLFVDPAKGPVLANYGIDEFRFTKPLYVGDSMQVNLTVKEKIPQDDREGEIPRGIVKWTVDVLDQSDECAATGTILTLVAKRPGKSMAL